MDILKVVFKTIRLMFVMMYSFCFSWIKSVKGKIAFKKELKSNSINKYVVRELTKEYKKLISYEELSNIINK